MGQILGLIGGTPLSAVGTVIAEYKRIAKTQHGGDMGGAVSSAVGGGLGSMVGNPVAGLMQQINSAISKMVGAMNAQPAGTDTSAINTANYAVYNAAAALVNRAGDLVGAGTNGPQTVLDVVATRSILSFLPADQAQGNLVKLMAPVSSDDLLTNVANQISDTATSLRVGAMGVAQAAAQLQQAAAQVNKVVSDSRAVVDWAQGIATTVSAASTIASVAHGSPEVDPDPVQLAFQRAIHPEMRDVLEAAAKNVYTPPHER